MAQQGEDMDKMQQEAMRRMQEMHTRAYKPKPQNRSRQPAPPASAQNRQTAKEQNTAAVKNEVCADEQGKSISKKSDERKDLFSELFRDKEKSLILLLILILSVEKADTGLILALMYLII